MMPGAPPLTRRQALARGGAALAGASVLGSGAGVGWAQEARGGLRKGLSMFGPSTLRGDAHPNDLPSWGNRQLLRRTGTTWVKLWISWADLQEGYRPESREDAWFDLNMAPGGEGWLWRLDRQVKAANDDGLGVILTLYHEYPTWSSSGASGDPDSPRGPRQRLPSDVSAEGPWAWFVEYLCARYSGGVNPVGPHTAYPGERVVGYEAGRGNPLGARIQALELCNEPNVLNWPQAELPATVAAMIRTASGLAARQHGPAILAPSTLDSPDPGEADDPASRTDWREFTRAVIEELGSFRPAVRVGWSHHNYRDIKRGVRAEESRASQVLRLARAWPGWDGRLWLTEGGLNLYPDQENPGAGRDAARLIAENFDQMRRLAGVFLWTQHAIHDLPDNPFKSGLYGDFRVGADPRPGDARPTLEVYADLPGAARR